MPSAWIRYPDGIVKSASDVLDDLNTCLSHLAAEAPDQIRYVRSLGRVSVDELALDLDDTLQLAWIPLEAGAVTEDQLAGARMVDDLLASFSGQANAEKWTEDGLTSAEEWKEVRLAAREAIRSL
jgi:hypothetical protein